MNKNNPSWWRLALWLLLTALPEGDEFRDLLSTYTILPNKKAAYISKLA